MTAHLITTPATGQACRHCHTPVLAGLAEGLHTRVDLTPLNPADEVAALLTGRWTYTLTRTGLIHRDATRIAGDTLTGPILADHKCRAKGNNP
jgi:hypothetical protein